MILSLRAGILIFSLTSFKTQEESRILYLFFPDHKTDAIWENDKLLT